MGLFDKNTFGIQLIILCLIIGCSACSKEADKAAVDEPGTEKVVDAETEKLEKTLQEQIDETYKKYLEIDVLQHRLNDNISTQLDSITCAANRLLLLKDNDLPSSSAIKRLIKMTELLEIKENKDRKFFHIITNRKYSYKYKTSHVPALVKCAEYYLRAIPNSKQARDLEAKVFAEEITRAIKRLNTFPQRFEILERLASEATTRQSFLQQRLDEYAVDNAPVNANAGADKGKDFIAETDKVLKQLNETPDMSPTPAEVLLVEDVFR